jgi:hypothetical protein
MVSAASQPSPGHPDYIRMVDTSRRSESSMLPGWQASNSKKSLAAARHSNQPLEWPPDAMASFQLSAL